jgi:hypothetical protein
MITRTGRGTLAAALGFLLLCSGSLFCLEELSLSGTAGSLWVASDGAAWYWLSGLSCRPSPQVYLKASAGALNSSLPWAGAGIPMFFFEGGADFKRIGFHAFWNFFPVQSFELKAGDFEFYNDGGEAVFVGVSLPVYLDPITIVPSFSTGSVYLNDGSLYWFFGKPVLPPLYNYGLAAGFAGAHFLNLRYLDIKPEIRSNEDERLFTAALDVFLASYTLKLGPAGPRKEQGGHRFEGTAGWLYAGGSLEGALTASNQNYMLFPFSFFSATGSLSTHVVYGMARLFFWPSIFRFDITLGAAHIVEGEINAGYHFKMKQLFSGSEFQGELDPLRLNNTGAAFLLFNGGIALQGSSRPYPRAIFLGIQKAFAIPWGYKKFIPGGSSESETDSTGIRSAFDAGLLRSILLSGLSLHVKISW